MYTLTILALLALLHHSPITSPFFFHSSRDHPDLHSFPTRRSSDLASRRRRWSSSRSAATAGGSSTRSRMSTSWSFTDRKSTRLNSSHITISYAVFCLKKKTKFISSLPTTVTIRVAHPHLQPLSWLR